MFSGNNILYFAILENLRIFQNCLFTEGVVEENGSCRACFLRKQPRSGQLARPLRHGLRRATSPKGRGSGETGNFTVMPRALPLGELASPTGLD